MALVVLLASLVGASAAAPEPQTLSVSVHPSAVAVNQGVPARLRMVGPWSATPHPRIQIQVEAGKVLPIQNVGPGTFEAPWTLPPELLPRRLAACVHDPSAPNGVVFTTLAVQRRARFSIQSYPDAQVRVFLQGEVAAATTANDQGEAVLSLLLAPGAGDQATVEHLRDGEVAGREVLALGVKDALRVWLVQGAPRTRGSALIFVYAYRDASPLGPVTSVEVTGDNLPLSLEGLAPGLWRVDVPLAGEPGLAQTTVSVSVRSEGQTATSQLIVSRPALEPPEPSLRWGLGPHLGFASDAGVLVSPIVGVGAYYPTPVDGLALSLDIEVQWAGLASSETKGEAWLLPTQLGLIYHLTAYHGVALAADFAAGPVIYGAETSALSAPNKGQAKHPRRGTGLAWQVGTALRAVMPIAPGELAARLGVRGFVVSPARWPGNRLVAGITVGYYFTFGS